MHAKEQMSVSLVELNANKSLAEVELKLYDDSESAGA